MLNAERKKNYKRRYTPLMRYLSFLGSVTTEDAHLISSNFGVHKCTETIPPPYPYLLTIEKLNCYQMLGQSAGKKKGVGQSLQKVYAIDKPIFH